MRSKSSNMEELAETQKSLAADEAYLAELNQSCAAKAAEWAARQKQAAEEQAAIEKAKEILADGSPSALRFLLRVLAILPQSYTATRRDIRCGEAVHRMSFRLRGCLCLQV